MYYLCSENKGADQLRGYCEADLRLCFRICKKPVFSRRGSNYLCRKKDKALISCIVTMQLICAFVFAYAKAGFLTSWLRSL